MCSVRSRVYTYPIHPYPLYSTFCTSLGGITSGRVHASVTGLEVAYVLGRGIGGYQYVLYIGDMEVSNRRGMVMDIVSGGMRRGRQLET